MELGDIPLSGPRREEVSAEWRSCIEMSSSNECFSGNKIKGAVQGK
jgi:hypothetical protein